MLSERERIKQEIVHSYHCTDPHAENCGGDCEECKKSLKNDLDTLEQMAFLDGCNKVVNEEYIKLPCKDVYFIVDIDDPKYAMVMRRTIRELAIYDIENIDKENCKYFSTEEKAKVRLKELYNN